MAPISRSAIEGSSALEADITLNALNIALSRSTRLLASWRQRPRPSARAATTKGPLNPNAPPNEPKEETSQPVPQDEIQTEHPNLFEAERAGVGLQPSGRADADGELKREHMAGNEKLRKQLLGGNHVRKSSEKETKSALETRDRKCAVRMRMGSHPARPQRPPAPRQPHTDSSSDNEGRSTLGKPKRAAATTTPPPPPATNPPNTILNETNPSTRPSNPSKKKPNYIDEVLAERLQKRRKKARRKDEGIS